MRFLAAIATMLACTLAHAAGFGLGALMALLKSSHPGRATYHETKYIAVLDHPVETSGTLSFAPPDHLEKKSEGLNAETLVADRDTVVIERGGRKQTLSLAQYPEIGVFVESIRGTLAGDEAALEKAYGLSLSGDAARWTLSLVPREESLQRIVKRIEIEGVQGRVRRVEIQQADGDRSVMVIAPAKP